MTLWRNCAEKLGIRVPCLGLIVGMTTLDLEIAALVEKQRCSMPLLCNQSRYNKCGRPAFVDLVICYHSQLCIYPLISTADRQPCQTL
jgi:hypothetical protein